MKRSILGFIVGLAVWVLVASLLNRILRFGLEGYTAAEPQMTFTHAMMAARLALGALASLAAGEVTRAFAPSSTRVLWVLGAVLLAAFIPVHVQLWTKFPVWYHPSVSGDSRTTCCTRRDVHSKPFAHLDERARQKRANESPSSIRLVR